MQYGYRRRRRSNAFGVSALLVTAVMLLFFLAYSITACAGAFQTQHVTLEAYAKDRGEDKRVYTTNGDGVYTVNDSWLRGHVNSGTIYAQLPVPFAGAAADTSKTVKLYCKVNGFRVPLFSMFKNILECEVARS